MHEGINYLILKQMPNGCCLLQRHDMLYRNSRLFLLATLLVLVALIIVLIIWCIIGSCL